MNIFLSVAVLIISFNSLFLPSNGYADDLPSSFKNYKEFVLPDGGSVFLSPTLKPTLVGGKINLRFPVFDLEIDYDSGPSEDPTFYLICKNEKITDKAEIEADELFVSEAGHFYATGRTNDIFKRNRKFTFNGKEIIEVKQAFYLVNMKCAVNQSTTLTTEPCDKGDIVASVPKGTEITVHMAPYEPDRECRGFINLLVSTPLGLVGWVKSQAGTLTSEGVPLPCIYYHGD